MTKEYITLSTMSGLRQVPTSTRPNFALHRQGSPLHLCAHDAPDAGLAMIPRVLEFAARRTGESVQQASLS